MYDKELNNNENYSDNVEYIEYDEEDILALNEELDELRERNQNLCKIINDIEAEKSELAKKLENISLNSENNSGDNTSDTENPKIKQLEMKIKQLESTEEELEALKAENEMLKKAADNSADNNGEIIKLKNEILQLEGSEKDLENLLKEKNEEIEELEKKLNESQSAGESSEELEALRAENEMLKKAADNNADNNGEIIKLKNEILQLEGSEKDLENLLKEKNEEIEELEKKLNEGSSAGESSEELEALKAENEKLNAKISANDNSLSKISELENTIMHLGENKKALEKTIAEKDFEIAELKNKIDDFVKNANNYKNIPIKVTNKNTDYINIYNDYISGRISSLPAEFEPISINFGSITPKIDNARGQIFYCIKHDCYIEVYPSVEIINSEGAKVYNFAVYNCNLTGNKKIIKPAQVVETGKGKFAVKENGELEY